MVNIEKLPQVAIDANNAFGGVVDELAATRGLAGVNPDLQNKIANALSGLGSSVTFSGSEQVAARHVGDMSRSNETGIA